MQPPEAPNHPPYTTEHVDNFSAPTSNEPEKQSWLKKRGTKIGIGIGALLLAGGLTTTGVAAMNGHDGKPSDKSTSLEVPNSQKPSASETKPADSKAELTPEKFVFTGSDGKTYEGEDAYEKSLEVTKEEYPDATDRFRRIVEVATGCETAGVDDKTISTYGKDNMQKVLDLYDNACIEAITDDSSGLASRIKAHHTQYLEAYEKTDGRFRVSTAIDKMSFLTSDNSTTVWVRLNVKQEDPNNPSQSFAMKEDIQASMLDMDDGNGHTVSRITDWEDGTGHMPFGN